MCRIVCKREKKQKSIVSVFVSCLLKLMKSVGKGLERTCKKKEQWVGDNVVEGDGIVRRKKQGTCGSGRERKWARRMGNVHSLIMSGYLEKRKWVFTAHNSRVWVCLGMLCGSL